MFFIQQHRYDFPLLLYSFFLSTNVTKMTRKNAKIGEIEKLELKIFRGGGGGVIGGSVKTSAHYPEPELGSRQHLRQRSL